MAISFVKNGGTNSSKSSGTTLTLTVPAGGHAAGNLVVVFLSLITGSLPAAPTDTRSNIYTTILTCNLVGAPGIIYASVLTTALQASDTITLSTSSGSVLAVNSAEFSGATINTDGSATSNNGAGTTTPTTPTFNTNDATDLLFGMVGANGPSGDSFTNDSATYCGSTWQALTRVGTTGGSAASNVTVDSAYLITVTTGSVNYDPTLGTSRPWCDSAVAVRASLPPPAPFEPNHPLGGSYPVRMPLGC